MLSDILRRGMQIDPRRATRAQVHNLHAGHLVSALALAFHTRDQQSGFSALALTSHREEQHNRAQVRP